VIERPLALHLHARFVTPEALTGAVVVVIDALRASVTMTTALANGAARVVPTLTVEEALSFRAPGASRGDFGSGAQTTPRRAPGARKEDCPLLGGERGGVLIPGFDLDNSPRAYTRERVGGRTIVFTTVNGTAALLHAKYAAEVLVGSFVNLSAVCERMRSDARPVHILCCGTRDEVSLDDVLVGGAMVERLIAGGRELVEDDSARVALHAWRDCAGNPVDAMKSSRGGRNLVLLGLGEDISACARVDSVPGVPRFDARSGSVTLS
jgi:2-phosphosulfolactate phosphatase